MKPPPTNFAPLWWVLWLGYDVWVFRKPRRGDFCSGGDAKSLLVREATAAMRHCLLVDSRLLRGA